MSPPMGGIFLTSVMQIVFAAVTLKRKCAGVKLSFNQISYIGTKHLRRLGGENVIRCDILSKTCASEMMRMEKVNR